MYRILITAMLAAAAAPAQALSSQAAVAPTLTKNTQGTIGYSVQELKDAGRTYIVFISTRITGTLTETAFSMNINKAGTVSTATSYTVTTGKTMRLIAFFCSITQTSGTAALSSTLMRVRQGTNNFAPGLGICETAMSGAILQSVGNIFNNLPDGIDIAAGSVIEVTHLESAVTASVSFTLYGFEY